MARKHEYQPHSPDASAQATRTREERRERITHIRERHANEKVLLGVLLAAGIIGALLYANTFEIRNAKQLAGVIVACVSFPTITLFCLYEPARRFIRWLRGNA